MYGGLRDLNSSPPVSICGDSEIDFLDRHPSFRAPTPVRTSSSRYEALPDFKEAYGERDPGDIKRRGSLANSRLVGPGGWEPVNVPHRSDTRHRRAREGLNEFTGEKSQLCRTNAVRKERPNVDYDEYARRTYGPRRNEERPTFGKVDWARPSIPSSTCDRDPSPRRRGSYD